MFLKLPAITFAAKIENDTCFRFFFKVQIQMNAAMKSPFLPVHSDLGIAFFTVINMI